MTEEELISFIWFALVVVIFIVSFIILLKQTGKIKNIYRRSQVYGAIGLIYLILYFIIGFLAR